MDKQTLEMILVGSGGIAFGVGVGLQLATYFYKYGKPAFHLVRAGAHIKREESHLAKIEVKAAGLSHAKGYVPSLAAKACMAAGITVLANTFVYDCVKSKVCKDYPTIATCFRERSYKPLYQKLFNVPSNSSPDRVK